MLIMMFYCCSSLIGSSNSSGDTEVSSDVGSCDVQLDMALAAAQASPPYHLQVRVGPNLSLFKL